MRIAAAIFAWLLLSVFAFSQSPTPRGFEPGCGGNMVSGSPAGMGPCEGNMVPNQTGGHGTSQGGGSTFTGPGDIVSGAQAWYGLRAYNAAYATANGKIVNLVRSSDSQTCDFLAASNGNIGNSANCSGAFGSGTLASFCNATTCSVATLYDQSGANNCTSAPCNATAAGTAQPTLTLNCINTSLPCLTFNGSTNILSATSGGTGSQPFTVAAVAKRTGAFTTAGQIFVSGPSQAGIGFTSSANTVDAFAGSNATATAADSAAHSLIGVINNASTDMVVDNTNTVGTASTNLWTTTTTIGAQSGVSFPMTGNFYEGGLWPSGFNSTQWGNMCHNQFTYWGTATSC